MRVLIITNRYPAGADDTASPFVPHFVAALQARRITVDVLTPNYGRTDGDDPDVVHRFRTGATIPVGSWSLRSPVTWWRLWLFWRNAMTTGRRLCRTHHYDHILALWVLPSGRLARRLGRRFGIRYSIWCLGSDIYVWARRRFARSMIRRVLRDATRVFADGEDLCERVQNGLGVACRFLPSFRPLPELYTGAPPQATATPRFLYLGRIHRAKGVYELAQAFLRVRDRVPGATLRFVGEGPEAEDLRRAIGLPVSSGVVRLDGPLDHAALVDALQTCDVVVIPSQSDSLPLVFSEAVQANRPVIGTDVGDLGRFIRRYRVGAVTPSLLPRDLAATMIDMARAPVFDEWGRHELLRLLDPGKAAERFCTAVLEANSPQGTLQSHLTAPRSPATT